MARSCGLRIGPRRFEFVVLDGAPKKHRIVAYYAGEFDPTDDDPMVGAAQALGQALDQHAIPKDNIGLVVDSAQAAFRRMTLPFTDRAKIEQVIKFEVEGELPQWNIDDVIVDFEVLSETEESCEVLVTAIPKEAMQSTLDICEKVGIEPLEAEIEATAMINAAMAADICHIDDAQVLVHVGDRSTAVAVIDAGELRDMRVIHIGAMTHEVTPASAGEDDAEEAPEALDPIEASRRNEAAIRRIRREVGRTISGTRTIHEVEAVYVCGTELPGLVGEPILDTPVYLLDCFDQDGGQPADGYGQLVVAYGSALRQLGGGALSPSLRREELRYTGTWERVEYPLAVASMMLFFVLFAIWFIQGQQHQKLNQNVRWWTMSLNKHLVGDARPGHLYPSHEDTKFVEEFKDSHSKPEDFDLSADLLAKLRVIDRELGKAVDNLKEYAGDGGIDMPQSAFLATSLLLGVFEDNKDEWRPSIRKLSANYQYKRQTKKQSVRLTLDVVFFDEDSLKATNDYEAFDRVMQSLPWVTEIQTKNTEELDSGDGISVTGIPITIDLDLYEAP